MENVSNIMTVKQGKYVVSGLTTLKIALKGSEAIDGQSIGDAWALWRITLRNQGGRVLVVFSDFEPDMVARDAEGLLGWGPLQYLAEGPERFLPWRFADGRGSR